MRSSLCAGRIGAWFLCAAIAIAALGLRVGQLFYGLTDADPVRTLRFAHPDEYGMALAIDRGYLRGSLDPGEFLNRGPAGYFVLGACDVAALRALELVGAPLSKDHDMLRNPALLIGLHRCFAALAALLAVGLCACLANELAGARAGGIAAALAAVSYLAVREAHFGTVDALFALVILVLAVQLLRYVQAPSGTRIALAGAALGAAIGLKYSAVLLTPALLVATALAERPGLSTALARRRSARHGGLAALGAAATFFALAPSTLWSAHAVFARVDHHRAQGLLDRSAAELGASVAKLVRHSLGIGLGEPVLALALLGAPLLWKRGTAGRTLLSVIALSLPLALLIRHDNVRYALPAALLLVPVAAVALQRVTRRWSLPALSVAVLLVGAPSLARSSTFVALLAREDTRLEAKQFLVREAAERRVLFVGCFGLPEPDGLRHLATVPGPVSIEDALRAAPEFVLFDLSWIEVQRRPFRATWPEVARHYELVFEVDGRSDPSQPLPDPVAGTPSVMVPFDRPWAMHRPGPPLAIYRRVARGPLAE